MGTKSLGRVTAALSAGLLSIAAALGMVVASASPSAANPAARPSTTSISSPSLVSTGAGSYDVTVTVKSGGAWTCNGTVTLTTYKYAGGNYNAQSVQPQHTDTATVTATAGRRDGDLHDQTTVPPAGTVSRGNATWQHRAEYTTANCTASSTGKARTPTVHHRSTRCDTTHHRNIGTSGTTTTPSRGLERRRSQQACLSPTGTVSLSSEQRQAVVHAARPDAERLPTSRRWTQPDGHRDQVFLLQADTVLQRLGRGAPSSARLATDGWRLPRRHLAVEPMQCASRRRAVTATANSGVPRSS